MVVLITNITDVPGPGARIRPTEVKVSTMRLRPGDAIRVDAKHVDEKMRKLESAGFISIGGVPPWYEDYKEKRRQKVTAEQAQSSISAAKHMRARKAAAKLPKGEAPKVEEGPVVVKKAELKETVSLSVDVTAKESKGRKKRG